MDKILNLQVGYLLRLHYHQRSPRPLYRSAFHHQALHGPRLRDEASRLLRHDREHRREYGPPDGQAGGMGFIQGNNLQNDWNNTDQIEEVRS